MKHTYKKIFRGKSTNFTTVVTKRPNGVFMVQKNVPYPLICHVGAVAYFRSEWMALNHAKRSLENAESIFKRLGKTLIM